MDNTITGPASVASTDVGVLDKVMEILTAVEGGAGTAKEVQDLTGLSRSTVNRMTLSLEQHGLLGRTDDRRWRLGPRLVSLGSAAVSGTSYTEALRGAAMPALKRLSDSTGESAQLYIRMGKRRVCIASSQSENELRTIVDVGADLPLTAGSAGKVFLGYAPEAEREPLLRNIPALTSSTVTDPGRLDRQISSARRRGWAQSVEERQEGVASVSAPVVEAPGRLAAVVSLSGPMQRLGRRPGQHHAAAVMHAAREIEQALGFA